MSLSATVLSERWGDLFGGINEAHTFAGTTIFTRADNIFDEYSSINQQRDVVDDLIEQARNVAGDVTDYTRFLFDRVQATLQAQCRDDTSRPTTDNLEGWFFKLNQDFKINGDNFRRPTVSGTISIPSGTTNSGDGYLITSVTEPVDGVVCYYAYAEIIRATCVSDSYSGQTDAGSEVFTIAGETAVGLTDYDWPKGSGGNSTITAVTPTTAGLLTDGDLDNWTLQSGTNYLPTDWEVHTGTTTSHLNREATTVYSTGGYSAKFTGDGATANTGIYQDLDQDEVFGNTNYAVSFWYRTDSATFTDGTLRVALTDGSGTVLTDNAGTSLSDTVSNTDLGNANGTWVQKRVTFATPRNLPTTLRLELKFTTAVDSGESVFIDHVIFSEMAQLYPGGPYHALHAGNDPFAIDDRFLNTVANSGGTSSFVRCLDRAFALADNGIRLLTTASATISDSLIT